MGGVEVIVLNLLVYYLKIILPTHIPLIYWRYISAATQS